MGLANQTAGEDGFDGWRKGCPGGEPRWIDAAELGCGLGWVQLREGEKQVQHDGVGSSAEMELGWCRWKHAVSR